MICPFGGITCHDRYCRGAKMCKYEMDEEERKLFDQLTRAEKKIFRAVMDSFPATKFASAHNVALQGGIKFQFTPT